MCALLASRLSRIDTGLSLGRARTAIFLLSCAGVREHRRKDTVGSCARRFLYAAGSRTEQIWVLDKSTHGTRSGGLIWTGPANDTYLIERRR
jgi:uncharacterized SAM-binding protein YcdF (DUF218 family)